MMNVLIIVVTLSVFNSALAAAPHKREWGDPIPDFGQPNYTCPVVVMKRSRNVPTSAHSVRPADINVIAALGDSLTAANGAGALDPVTVLLQYRGLAFLIGGDKSLDEHITLPNILKKFNSRLYGASYGVGTADVYQVSQLNIGQPGGKARDLLGQARELVHRMQTHPEVDINNDWKLINMFIGGNDICGYCHDPAGNTAERFAENIQAAVQFLYDSLPRTIVNLVGMFHLEMLRTVDNGQFFCDALHLFECRCESDDGFTNDEISSVCVSFMQAQYAIQNNGTFDKRDDFTFIIQPFLQDVRDPPRNPDGSVMLSFFAPDCFHFSQYGHALVAKATWNVMLQPVGHKETNVSFSEAGLPMACPDPACPFIRTTKNSINCATYLTEAIDD